MTGAVVEATKDKLRPLRWLQSDIQILYIQYPAALSQQMRHFSDKKFKKIPNLWVFFFSSEFNLYIFLIYFCILFFFKLLLELFYNKNNPIWLQSN